MRRAVLLLATMALAILAASGVAGAIINGEPDRNRHPYVGALVTELEVAEGQIELVPVCSGTLISPTVFLTAGHCTEFVIEENLPTFVSFDPTYESGASELISGTPHTHPDFSPPDKPGLRLPQSQHFDVGVIVLDQPVTNLGFGELPEPGVVNTLEKGQRLTLVGYGLNDWLVGGGPPQPLRLATRYRAEVKYLGTYTAADDMFIKYRGASMGRSGEGGCYGDSGGPHFLPGQRTIVAVESFGPSLLCAGVGYAQRVDLPVIRSWVRGFL